MTDEEEFLQEFYGKDDIKLTEKSCATCNFYMTPSYCDADPVCKGRSKWVKTAITNKEQAVEYILSLELEKGNKILQTREVIEAMLQAYLDGFAKGKIEGYEQGKNNERKLQCGKKNYGKDIARLEKENEELKALIPQWHDLRKNPDDLPTKEDITIRCVLSNGNEVICKTYWNEPAEDEIGYGKIIIQFYCNDDWIDTSDVIAWSELPKFEE